ncbi:MAG: fibronectin type III domain-containing protein [Planctomycetota bacterium]
MRSNSLLKIAIVIMFIAYITALNYGGCGGGGGSSGSSATVANRAPVLSPIGNQTIAEGATLTLTISGTDPDGDTLTYTISNPPLGASFDAATHTFSWTPAYNNAGTYTGIRFRVTDPTYLAAEETITITVTDVAAPNAPSGLAANAVSASQIDLTWTDNSADETGFKIERAPASGGQAGTYNQIDTVSASITSYSDTGLTEATAYYYRVCADNNVGSSAWSNEADATTPLNPPVQVASPAPADGANNVSINTQLSWASAVGASSYDVYLGTSNPPDYKTHTAYGYCSAGTLSYSTLYYWRVNSNNSGGTTTGIVWSFTTEAPPPPPAQVTSPNPADGVANISITRQLAWASASGATSYDVYFGTANPPPISQTNIAITGYNPGFLAFSATYYWRIDSKNGGGTTTGNIWSFSTKPPTPPAQVASPIPTDSAANVSITTQLVWASAEDATSYDVYFGTTNPPPLSQTGTTATTYNPGALAFTTIYYWRIDSKNSTGTTTGQVWSFTTKNPAPPAQVTTPNPAEGAAGVITTTQLSWASAADATSYDVYFGTTAPGTFIGNQAGTAYNPGTLSDNGVYYWRVDSKNTGGTTTGQVWSFTTSLPPAQAASPSPSNGAISCSVTAQLSWASATDATSYDVYFGTTAPGTFIGNQAGTTYNPGKLSVRTTYYWRVDSKNAFLTTQGNVWSFTTTGPTNNIMLTGYWPNTNEMLREFSTNLSQNPGGWQGANWEGRGYNIYSYFPEFPGGAGINPKGNGDFEVDYQDVGSWSPPAAPTGDFWRITGLIHPVAIMSYGMDISYLTKTFEMEYNARNLSSWYGDYLAPTQPTPAPPDTGKSSGYVRNSSLPLESIAEAINGSGLGATAWIDWTGDPQTFLCEYMAYHDSWYQDLHSDPDDQYHCVAAGFAHVAGMLSASEAAANVKVALRTLIKHLDSQLIQYTISGTVAVSGVPLAGVTMCGLPLGGPDTVTNSSGVYSAQVGAGWSGAVTPLKSGYAFNSSQRTYSNVGTNQSAQDYTAVTATAETITFDASSASTSTYSSTISWTHTVGIGNNRVLVVGAVCNGGGITSSRISSVKFNGVNMSTVPGSTKSLIDRNGGVGIDLYYMLNPPAGSNTVLITYPGVVGNCVGGAISLNNVKQQAPEIVAANMTYLSATTISTDVTVPNSGAWIVDVVGQTGSGSFTTSTSMERWDQISNYNTGACSTQAVISPGLNTMSWIYSGTLGYMLHSVAVFAPSEIIE